jgi:hypothetical protein
MNAQGGSAAKGGEDEVLERLSSALIEKFAKMIHPIETRLMKLEGHQKESKVVLAEDEQQFKSPRFDSFDEAPNRRESFGVYKSN